MQVQEPDVFTIFQIIGSAVSKLRDKPAIILWSAFLLLLAWGYHGEAAWVVPKAYREALFPGLAWRDQLVTFLSGAVLLVAVPCAIIKVAFKERLAGYGLGLPKGQMALAGLAVVVTLALSLPAVWWLGKANPDMRAAYPLFGRTSAGGWVVTGWQEFLLYELAYALFFLAIEFFFRGYLLFGLYGIEDVRGLEGVKGIQGPLIFGLYAILIQMLSYTVWHLGKPAPEVVGTIFWGIGTAAIVLKLRSIWPVFVAHWIMNIVLDVVVWTSVA